MSESRKAVTGDALPEASGFYSHAIVTGDLVFTAGQGPFVPGRDEPVGEVIAEQTQVTMENLAKVLEAAGSSLDQVVKVTVYLKDLSDFAEFDRTYGEFFTEPFPARTTIGADLDGFLIEIDAVASTGQSPS